MSEHAVKKVKDLEALAIEELKAEETERAKEIIKERLRELREAKKIVNKLEKQYQDFLDRNVDDIDE